MVDDINNVEKPVVVSASQGTLDAIYALIRQLTLISAGFTLLWKLIGTRDFIGILNYLQSNEGVLWLGALSTAIALIWGQVKTWRRGDQIATVAASSRVPDAVAKIAK